MKNQKEAEISPTASNYSDEKATDVVLEHYQIPCVSLKNSFANKKKPWLTRILDLIQKMKMAVL